MSGPARERQTLSQKQALGQRAQSMKGGHSRGSMRRQQRPLAQRTHSTQAALDWYQPEVVTAKSMSGSGWAPADDPHLRMGAA